MEGEFCPGAYSIRSGGGNGVKHAGLAQRVKRRAARLEALILVSNTAGLIPVLQHFYKALGLPFRPEGVADLDVSTAQVVDALSREVGRKYGAKETGLDEDLLSRARLTRGTWRASPRRP